MQVNALKQAARLPVRLAREWSENRTSPVWVKLYPQVAAAACETTWQQRLTYPGTMERVGILLGFLAL